MREHGFIDLRVGRGAQAAGDYSMWPSLSGVMMMIVMVFLMALAVMMARNFELDRQLTAGMSGQEAEAAESSGLSGKLAALEARNIGLRRSLGAASSERDSLRVRLQSELQRIKSLAAGKAALEKKLAANAAERKSLGRERRELAEQQRLNLERLAGTQAEIAELGALGALLRGRAAELQREHGEARAREAKLSRELAALSAQFRKLELRTGGEINTLGKANQSLTEQLAAVSAQLGQVTAVLYAEQQQAGARQAEANAEIETLVDLIRKRQAENDALQRLADASGKKARALQEEYDELDAKYRQLARPPRSPAGKHVVDVFIDKPGRERRFRMKEPAQNAPLAVTRAKLENRLAELQRRHGRGLYVEIIPGGKLPQKEARQLTREILRKYDYYYQAYPDAAGTAE
ncbi:MAG: hypothetical protein OD817_08035 [Gammaproteobacteria bacterium]